MEREKLLKEYEATLESLVEKTKFVYSEEFYRLDEFDKQKYHKDKMATEGHLSTLCTLLWGKTPQVNIITDLFAMSIIGSMFNGGFGSPIPSADYLKKTLDDDKKKDEHVYAFPVS